MSVEYYEDKSQPQALLKFDAAAGTGTCLFSRFDCVDKDLDVTRATFLPNGVTIPLLVAHKWDQLPSGKARIRVERHAAYADFELADSREGKALGDWLRWDFSNQDPKSEWSYGFRIKPGGSSRGVFEGQSVRFLHGIEATGEAGGVVKEISYVLAGAGIDTALVTMKGAEAAEQARWRRLHAKVTAQIEADHQRQQAEIRAMYARFMAKHGGGR